MKKFIIFVLMFVFVIYLGTGRFSVIERNINAKGIGALAEEPFWLIGWIGEQLHITKQLIDGFIDGKEFGRKVQVK